MEVRFTGRRTGQSAMFVPGYGTIGVGQIVEVDEETGARWTQGLEVDEDGNPSGDADFEVLSKKDAKAYAAEKAEAEEAAAKAAEEAAAAADEPAEKPADTVTEEGTDGR